MPKRTTKKTEAEELDALAHHIAEALRIMRESELIPARIYNDFADAWNEVCNFAIGESRVWDSEEYARLVLAEIARKGGAK
jgi:hypothetical protein